MRLLLLLLFFATTVSAFYKTVIGCVIPGPQYLNVGEKARLPNDKEYECKPKGKYRDVELVESIAKDAKCDGGHLHGETWIENKSFKYLCAEYGVVQFLSCVCPDNETEVLPNTTATYGRARITCTQHLNGTVTFHCLDNPKSYTCLWPGGSFVYLKYSRGRQPLKEMQTYKQGEMFVADGAIVAECMLYGRIKYLGCYNINTHFYIPFGHHYEEVLGTWFCYGNNREYALATAKPQTPKEYFAEHPEEDLELKLDNGKTMRLSETSWGSVA